MSEAFPELVEGKCGFYDFLCKEKRLSESKSLNISLQLNVFVKKINFLYKRA
ncbi:Uncharacterized protein dnm_058470 [Desulfonema magnum]|uniref:Uncharacterized protein n=1 Tax=Desulfonema magnum TaxID=45655 RepID=A0A975GQD5_9BACT|nr:Uncharacterized protein dnm_058470 [Desulfonema magnum]